MKISLLIIFLFLLPYSYAAMDPDTDGLVPEYFTRFLTNGSTLHANFDFSTIPQNFTAQPNPGEVWRISRLIFTIVDTGVDNFDDYGNLPALTNGLDMGIVRDGNVTLFNPTANTTDERFMIKSNGDWARIMFDVDLKNDGPADDYVVGRWTFETTNTKIRLDGDTNDSIFIEFSDDLSGLSDHTFIIQGYKERASSSEVSRMSLSIILTLWFVIAFYGFIIFMIRKETFEDHSMIKIAIMVLCAWLVLLPLYFSRVYNDFVSGPPAVSSILDTLYTVSIYLNIAMTFYLLVFMIVSFMRSANESGDGEK